MEIRTRETRIVVIGKYKLVFSFNADGIIFEMKLNVELISVEEFKRIMFLVNSDEAKRFSQMHFATPIEKRKNRFISILDVLMIEEECVEYVRMELLNSLYLKSLDH